MASGVTNSAASVRSPSFSRSSSSATTIIRPALNSSRAPGTSVNGIFACIALFSALYLSDVRSLPADAKNAALGGVFCFGPATRLQRGFDFKTPSLEQRLRDILRILVAPGPFAQPCRTHVLIGSQLKLFNHLFERSDSRDHRAYRLRLAPVGITTSFCHLIRYPLGR